MNFNQLINSIELTHEQLSSQAVKQVNYLQTIRNWLIGYYIVEFEQNGEDRAEYGRKFMENTAKRLAHVRGMAVSNLKNFRQFYLTYQRFLPYMMNQTVFFQIRQTLSGEFEKNDNSLSLPVETLINTLSFSHFIELLRLDSDIKRRFYEIEAVKNAWKVRELERAINTLLFERTGLSTDKLGVISKIKDSKPFEAKEIVKSPYFLEFLGLEEKTQYSENDL